MTRSRLVTSGLQIAPVCWLRRIDTDCGWGTTSIGRSSVSSLYSGGWIPPGKVPIRWVSIMALLASVLRTGKTRSDARFQHQSHLSSMTEGSQPTSANPNFQSGREASAPSRPTTTQTAQSEGQRRSKIDPGPMAPVWPQVSDRRCRKRFSGHNPHRRHPIAHPSQDIRIPSDCHLSPNSQPNTINRIAEMSIGNWNGSAFYRLGFRGPPRPGFGKIWFRTTRE